MFKLTGLQAKFSALFYLVLLTVMFIIGWYGYQHAKNAYTEAALNLAQNQLIELSGHINDTLTLSRDNLDFISHDYALQRLFYWADLGEPVKQGQFHQMVIDTLRGFAVSYPYNFKVRIIKPNGFEYIVAQRDPVNGKVRILPDNELESRSDKAFFPKL